MTFRAPPRDRGKRPFNVEAVKTHSEVNSGESQRITKAMKVHLSLYEM